MPRTVYPRERLYFVLVALSAALFYYVAIVSIVGIVIVGLIAFVVYGLRATLIGYIRGNGVRVDDTQLPEVHAISQQLVDAMQMRRPPQVYVVQAGAILAAITRRLLTRRHFVVLSAEIAEQAQHDPDTVRFIMAQEFARVYRQINFWDALLAPGLWVPLIGSAYLRCVAHSCDRVAVAAAGAGAERGMMLYATGPTIYPHSSFDELAKQGRRRGFWGWLFELLSPVPLLTRRARNVQRLLDTTALTPAPSQLRRSSRWDRGLATALLVAAPLLAGATWAAIDPAEVLEQWEQSAAEIRDRADELGNEEFTYDPDCIDADGDGYCDY